MWLYESDLKFFRNLYFQTPPNILKTEDYSLHLFDVSHCKCLKKFDIIRFLLLLFRYLKLTKTYSALLKNIAFIQNKKKVGPEILAFKQTKSSASL